MKFEGVKLMDTGLLGLSQIYLSADKIAGVREWFDPQSMENFQPLPVHDFGNGRYTLTDGHTRAYVAHKCGITRLPVVYDTDDTIINPVGQMLYRADIAWCERFKLFHIWDLENRILTKEAYKKLWMERCDRSHNLLMKTARDVRARLQTLAPDLFLYGLSDDFSTLYFESESGQLFLYKDDTLMPEEPVF